MSSSTHPMSPGRASKKSLRSKPRVIRAPIRTFHHGDSEDTAVGVRRARCGCGGLLWHQFSAPDCQSAQDSSSFAASGVSFAGTVSGSTEPVRDAGYTCLRSPRNCGIAPVRPVNYLYLSARSQRALRRSGCLFQRAAMPAVQAFPGWSWIQTAFWRGTC